MCVILLLATFGTSLRARPLSFNIEYWFYFTAMGIVDTTYDCTAVFEYGDMKWQPDPHADGFGILYSGFSYGVAATALSLSTNLFATVAVTIKAW